MLCQYCHKTQNNIITNYCFYFFPHGWTGLIFEISRLWSNTPQPVGLLWASDRPVSGTSTWQNTKHTTDIHALGGIRTLYPSNRRAADPFLRPCGHRDFYYYLEMARNLKLFGQASSMFSYQETCVIGRPVQLYDRCSNLRLGDISCGPPLIFYWGVNSSFPITIHSLARFQESRTRLRLKDQCQAVRGCGQFNHLNPELNPICYLLALLAHHFLHVNRIIVKSLTLRLLMSYMYGVHIFDVSRSHTTTHHSW